MYWKLLQHFQFLSGWDIFLLPQEQQRGNTKGEVGGLQQHEGDEKPGAPAFDVWMITSLQLLCQGLCYVTGK